MSQGTETVFASKMALEETTKLIKQENIEEIERQTIEKAGESPKIERPSKNLLESKEYGALEIVSDAEDDCCERAANRAPASAAKKPDYCPNIDGQIPAFLSKLWQMVNADSTLAKWNATGTHILVNHRNTDSLQKYFKTNKFPSFIRQLNMYGFKKVMNSNSESEILEFRNENFLRHRPELIRNMRRRVKNCKMALSQPTCVLANKNVASPKPTGGDVECRLQAAEAELTETKAELAKHKERLERIETLLADPPRRESERCRTCVGHVGCGSIADPSFQGLPFFLLRPHMEYMASPRKLRRLNSPDESSRDPSIKTDLAQDNA